MTPSTPTISEEHGVHSIGQESFLDAPIHYILFGMLLALAVVGIVCSVASSA